MSMGRGGALGKTSSLKKTSKSGKFQILIEPFPIYIFTYVTHLFYVLIYEMIIRDSTDRKDISVVHYFKGLTFPMHLASFSNVQLLRM